MKDCQRTGGDGGGGSGGNIAHVKGNWRIRVKGQTGREGTQHNKGRAAVQKRTRMEGKREGRSGRGSLRKVREIAGRPETVFLGIKDLLSGARAEGKGERE